MLRVSTHTNFVTPNEPCYLAGYPTRTQKNDGVLDDLKCTAVVIQVDHRVVVNVDVEVLTMTRAISEKAKDRLIGMFDLERELITIASIRTHAAPETRVEAHEAYDEADAEVRDAYNQFLEDTIVETVKACYDKGFEYVQAFCRTVEIDGLYGNRYGDDKPEDKEVTILNFVGENSEVKAAIVNIACQASILSPRNLLISGDLLGFISRRVKAVYGVYPLMMQGAAGDMSTRNYRLSADPKELKRIGMGIVRQMFDGEDSYERVYFTTPIEEKNSDGTASIIRMGDFVICKMHGEPNAEIGLKIKEASGAKFTAIWSYVDDDACEWTDARTEELCALIAKE